MEEEKIIIDYDMIIAAKSGSMQALGYIDEIIMYSQAMRGDKKSKEGGQ